MIAPSPIDLHRDAIADLCRRYQIIKLSLFGSAARGEMRPDSDVDLLVEFALEARVGLIRHLATQRELSAILGKKVDLVSKRALRDPIRAEIETESRLVYAA